MLLPRLLVIEDHRELVSVLRQYLKRDYEVDTAATGAEGIIRAASRDYDGIILDLGLPDISGLLVCRRLRAEGCTSPIIVITGEASLKTKLVLFDAGAKDYLVKPFSIEELKARLKAIIPARRPASRAIKLYAVGSLMIDPLNRSVEREGRSILLRQKEFAILECLAENAGMVVTRTALVHHAWNSSGTIWTDTVNVHIKYLRDKVDRPFSQPMIKTVRGLGYKLDVPDVSPQRT